VIAHPVRRLADSQWLERMRDLHGFQKGECSFSFLHFQAFHGVLVDARVSVVWYVEIGSNASIGVCSSVGWTQKRATT
jgi:hypothetical protein